MRAWFSRCLKISPFPTLSQIALAPVVQPGSRVLASLGRSVREGVVVAVMEKPELPDSSIEIKPLVDCLDDSPTFSDELLALTKWIAEYYLSSWGEALKSAIPGAVRHTETQRRPSACDRRTN